MMSVAAARKALERAGIDARPDRLRHRRHRHATCSRRPPSRPRSPTSSAPTSAAAFDISAACAGFCHGVALAADMVRGGSAEPRARDRRRAALRHHRRRATAAPRSSSPTAPAPPSSVRPTTPGIGPVVVGLRRRAVRPDPAARGLARRDRHRERPGDAAPASCRATRSSAGRRSRWPRSASRPSTAPASPSTTSTSSCPTRPTCASSTRWPRSMKLPERVEIARDIADQGNTSAASIPLALDRMIEEGEAQQRRHRAADRLRRRPRVRRPGRHRPLIAPPQRTPRVTN